MAEIVGKETLPQAEGYGRLQVGFDEPYMDGVVAKMQSHPVTFTSTGQILYPTHIAFATYATLVQGNPDGYVDRIVALNNGNTIPITTSSPFTHTFTLTRTRTIT